ncbi:tetratricopeptide repeat protein [Candidatus Uhrbacteria bacterium]|nr:tetratricopeptide repeat protein [Candidatus Uhrbacteria bacterium]
MILNVISIFIIIICIAAIAYLVGRRLRIVASINIDALPQEREASVRKRILRERLLRSMHEWREILSRFAIPLFAILYRFFHRSYAKLRAVKESYPSSEDSGAAGKKTVIPDDLISRGFESIEKESYYDAEQDFIEAIKLDPRRVDPYMGLSRVYLEQKEFKEAEATLKHVLRLARRIDAADSNFPSSPESIQTEVLYDLWEVCILQGRSEEALSWILKAVEMEANNPRFLDSLTATYIALGRRLYAEQALDRLRAANPENKKIVEFFGQISKLSY